MENQEIETLDLTEAPRKPKVYILHHRDCDGYAAGAIAFSTLADSEKELKLIDVQYGEPFPDIEITKEDEVFILDFSYKRDVLDNVYNKAKKLLVLDHHKTAEEELRGTPYSHFDMTKSGVLLAWEYFCPGFPITEQVAKLDCYDLWKKDHELYNWDSIAEFHMACHTQLENYSFWVGLMSGYKIDPKLYELGKDLYQRFLNSVDEIVESVSTQFLELRGVSFCFFFCEDQISLVSDSIYNHPNYNVDVTVCLFREKKNKQWVASLRSKNSNLVDVSELAKKFNGGGHASAAGFKIDVDLEEVEIMDYVMKQIKDRY